MKVPLVKHLQWVSFVKNILWNSFLYCLLDWFTLLLILARIAPPAERHTETSERQYNDYNNNTDTNLNKNNTNKSKEVPTENTSQPCCPALPSTSPYQVNSPKFPRPPSTPKTRTFTRDNRNQCVRNSFDNTNKLFLDSSAAFESTNRANCFEASKPLWMTSAAGCNSFRSLGDVSDLIREEDENEDCESVVDGRRKSLSTSCIPDIFVTSHYEI